MYISDIIFIVFFLVVVVLLALGIFLFLGVPGAILFGIFDIIPSLFLGELHGDNILPIGMKYSFTWPIVVLASFILSKLKFGKFNNAQVEGKFSLIWFAAFLLPGSMLLAATFHQIALPTPPQKADMDCKLIIDNDSNPRNCINDNYFRIIERHYNYHLKQNPTDTGDMEIALTTDAIGSIVSTKVTTNIESAELIKRINNSETWTSFTEQETRDKVLVYYISHVK